MRWFKKTKTAFDEEKKATRESLLLGTSCQVIGRYKVEEGGEKGSEGNDVRRHAHGEDRTPLSGEGGIKPEVETR